MASSWGAAQYLTFRFIQLLRGLAKSSHEVSSVAWMAAVRQRERALWLAILKIVPWGVSLVVVRWYLCISFVSSCVKLVVGECFVC